MAGRTMALSVFRVRTRMHSSWYPAFLVLVWALVTQLPGGRALWQGIIYAVAGVLLFVVVMNLRQFVLNLLAVLIGMPLKNVTVFVFGGSSRVPKDATSPALELTMAGGGLVLNLLIAGVYQWLSLKESITSNLTIGPAVQWSAFFWYMLTLFHTLPGLPLEGGRVLLAVLWKTTGNYVLAASVVAWFGWGLGIASVAGGVALLVFARETVNGVLLALLGWVLQRGAAHTRDRVILLATLHNARARDVMSREFTSVAPGMSVRELVYDHALVTGRDDFAVAEEGRLLGVISVDRIRRIPRRRWRSTFVEDVMTPAGKVRTVQAGQSAAHVIEAMDQWRLNEVPVLAEGYLVGIVTRERLMRLARIRTELRV